MSLFSRFADCVCFGCDSFNEGRVPELIEFANMQPSALCM